MNFDSLYKLVLEEKIIVKILCLICYREATNDNIKLKCNHYFHENVLWTLKIKKSSFKFECPYCKTITIIYNKKPKILSSLNKNEASNKKICLGIVKSGARKGLQCTHIARNGDYCKKHLPKSESLVI